MVDVSHVIYVDSPAVLAQAVELIAPFDQVGLDTEADSLHHFREKICLIQLSVPGSDIIVDPLVELDISSLLDCLVDKELLIHGADYDLRMMKRAYQFAPTRIFDTMLAAQLLGYERFSYAALVEQFHEVVLSKQAQKADWSVRPLTEKMMHYAACDTHYVLSIAESLRGQLAEKGRLEWHKEICEKLLDTVSDAVKVVDPERQWRIKGWHKLRPGRGWAALRELWHWRNNEAERTDLPPFKLFRNELLIEYATWVQDGAVQDAMPPLPRNIQGRRRREFEQALSTAQALPPSQFPKALKGERKEFLKLDDRYSVELKLMRDEHAKFLQLDPGVLFPSSLIAATAGVVPQTREQLEKIEGMYRWQIAELGDKILEAIQKAKTAPHKTTSVSKDNDAAPATTE